MYSSDKRYDNLLANYKEIWIKNILNKIPHKLL